MSLAVSICNLTSDCRDFSVHLSHVLDGWKALTASLNLSDYHSSDSDGHFDTPEAATPVRTPPTIPGELENSNTDADTPGEPLLLLLSRKQTEKDEVKPSYNIKNLNTLTPQGS